MNFEICIKKSNDIYIERSSSFDFNQSCKNQLIHKRSMELDLRRYSNIKNEYSNIQIITLSRGAGHVN